MAMPEWMKKYPCSSCGTGHGACSQGWIHSLMCCKKCDHPNWRVLDDPWTAAEYEEMWRDHNPGTSQKEELQRLIRKESIEGNNNE